MSLETLKELTDLKKIVMGSVNLWMRAQGTKP